MFIASAFSTNSSSTTTTTTTTATTTAATTSTTATTTTTTTTTATSSPIATPQRLLTRRDRSRTAPGSLIPNGIGSFPHTSAKRGSRQHTTPQSVNIRTARAPFSSPDLFAVGESGQSHTASAGKLFMFQRSLPPLARQQEQSISFILPGPRLETLLRHHNQQLHYIRHQYCRRAPNHITGYRDFSDVTTSTGSSQSISSLISPSQPPLSPSASNQAVYPRHAWPSPPISQEAMHSSLPGCRDDDSVSMPYTTPSSSPSRQGSVHPLERKGSKRSISSQRSSPLDSPGPSDIKHSSRIAESEEMSCNPPAHHGKHLTRGNITCARVTGKRTIQISSQKAEDRGVARKESLAHTVGNASVVEAEGATVDNISLEVPNPPALTCPSEYLESSSTPTPAPVQSDQSSPSLISTENPMDALSSASTPLTLSLGSSEKMEEALSAVSPPAPSASSFVPSTAIPIRHFQLPSAAPSPQSSLPRALSPDNVQDHNREQKSARRLSGTVRPLGPQLASIGSYFNTHALNTVSEEASISPSTSPAVSRSPSFRNPFQSLIRKGGSTNTVGTLSETAESVKQPTTADALVSKPDERRENRGDSLHSPKELEKGDEVEVSASYEAISERGLQGEHIESEALPVATVDSGKASDLEEEDGSVVDEGGLLEGTACCQFYLVVLPFSDLCLDRFDILSLSFIFSI